MAVRKKKAVTKKPARKKQAPGTVPRAKTGTEKQLTCFVVIGFGTKTDYMTGRVLNLDKTYEQLIRPAFDKVDVNCFRAIDANLSGSIDSIMYRWIYEADIVVADLSTLNANVFYELGVRHAQKPNTTIIIAESVLMQRIPFDLSSFVIHQYEHGGEDISATEQERFVKHLSGILKGLIDVEKRRREAAPDTQAESDSPVFQFLTDMQPPAYDAESFIEPPPYVAPEDRDTTAADKKKSLAAVIDAAEAAKKDKQYADAIDLFQEAIDLETEDQPDPKKPDLFLAQRLTLVTYKEGEEKDADGNIDKKRAIKALNKAEGILAKYCAPNISNDPETLGLSGAINKRLFELTDDTAYLDKAIHFYERGFYVKRDYYNGINVAYMYTQKANLSPDHFEAIVNYGHANKLRLKVAEICNELIEDQEAFARRGDQEWVYMTLAECYQGLERADDETRLADKIEDVATDFGKDSYQWQKEKLAKAIEEFKRRVRPDQLGATPAPASVEPAGPGPVKVQAARPVTVVQPRPGASSHPIVIDADVVPGKPIKSIEVNYKIEYG